ncbi:cytochrome 450-like protein [Tupanvirus deep ocean]|uniref:Cytochrome 450-like protein n=2 Tax=Tupanvirus TaxID=2094720 RepID=A0AC62A7G3_9VIRU|nr:cytochrome 450-like protein [Tupanvirus deep ocean]QKU33730.1 cytochrome 450-like protein [Tupanvirus deep ocean]
MCSNKNKERIIWSLKSEHLISPIRSWMIVLLNFIDRLIPRFWIFKNIPTLGGDIYDFSKKGLFKFILDKFNNRNDNEKYNEIRFVHMPLSLIFDGDLSKKILLSKNVGRGKTYDRLTDFFGYGIFTSKIHDKWLHQRRLVLSLFTKKNLSLVTTELTNSMFKELDRLIACGDHFDLVSLLSQIGLVGFCDVFFGVDIKDISSSLIAPLNRLLVYINGAAEPFVIKMDPAYRAYAKDKKFVHKWMHELIDRAKKSTKCHPIIAAELHRDDLDIKELGEFVLSIVLGGHETTARLMLGIIYCIYHDNQCIDKLNAETHSYLNEKSNYEFDILKQSYLNKIIKEGTRLFPPVWILGRETFADLEIDNILFKKGTQFLISPLIFLRDEKIWGSDAEIFKPERFDKLTTEQKNIFIPFVVGIENCPGKLFAELEASIVVSKLFYHYQIKFLEHSINPTSAGTFRLTDVLPVQITKK